MGSACTHWRCVHHCHILLLRFPFFVLSPVSCGSSQKNAPSDERTQSAHPGSSLPQSISTSYYSSLFSRWQVFSPKSDTEASFWNSTWCAVRTWLDVYNVVSFSVLTEYTLWEASLWPWLLCVSLLASKWMCKTVCGRHETVLVKFRRSTVSQDHTVVWPKEIPNRNKSKSFIPSSNEMIPRVSLVLFLSLLALSLAQNGPSIMWVDTKSAPVHRSSISCISSLRQIGALITLGCSGLGTTQSTTTIYFEGSSTSSSSCSHWKWTKRTWSRPRSPTGRLSVIAEPKHTMFVENTLRIFIIIDFRWLLLSLIFHLEAIQCSLLWENSVIVLEESKGTVWRWAFMRG